MRYELRLFAAALLILSLIAASCRCQAIAEVRRGLDGPPAEHRERAERCDHDCGDNLKNRGKTPERIATTAGAARK
ncbi:MAG TPA: hypothetical protein VKR38_08425 [Usitatibacter sp.]|nr:hypothetical protein [Usitatibacter sp.]